jgi:CheY-specific phosphatase CheX
MGTLEKNISKVVCDASRLRLLAHLNHPNVSLTVDEIDFSDEFQSKWLSLILVTGMDIRISFKVFFDISDIKNLLTLTGVNELNNDLSDDLVFDFVNEYCNLTAGKIQQALSEQSVKLGISLPMVSRGFDDVYFTSHDEGVFKSTWNLTINSVTLTCCAEVHVLNSQKFSDFKYIPVVENIQSKNDIFNF